MSELDVLIRDYNRKAAGVGGILRDCVLDLDHSVTLAVVRRIVDESPRMRSIIRRYYDVHTPNSVPIQVIEGDQSPSLSGTPPHYVFPGGRWVRHPGAARRSGYRVEYVRDTRVVTVGHLWVIDALAD
jgi:hypothetical protein